MSMSDILANNNNNNNNNNNKITFALSSSKETEK